MTTVKRGRSASKKFQCLFCFKLCPRASSSSTLIPGEILGAVRSVELHQHLQHLFVLRNLLDVPSSWCAEVLQRNDGAFSPGSWFRICDSCAGLVTEAWETYQKVLTLESRLSNIRGQVRDKMRENVMKGKGKIRGIEYEIWSLLFPDLLVAEESDSFNNLPIPNSEYDDLLETNSNYSGGVGDSCGSEFSNKYGTTGKRGKGGSQKGKRKKRKFLEHQKLGNIQAQKKRRSNHNQTPQWHWRKCEKCSAKFKDTEEYEAHLKAHKESEQRGGRYDCSMCSFPARDEVDLERHVNHSHINRQIIRSYSCPKCEFKVGAWKNLKSHLQEKHPDIPEEEYGNEFQLKCHLCQKTFTNRNAIIIHQKKVHPEVFLADKVETVECDQCAMRFASKITLQYHINNTHMRIMKYVCDDCGKGFRWLKNLDRHKVTHQKGKREFVCHICGCDYSYQSILDKHYRTFHSEEDARVEKSETTKADSGASGEEFKCKHCDLTSQFKVVIMRHMEKHKAEMGHQCDICNKYYTHVSGLRRHKRINHPTENQEVNCQYCLKVFPNAYYMKSHVAKYCKLKNPKNSSPSKVADNEQCEKGDVVESQNHDIEITVPPIASEETLCILPDTEEVIEEIEGHIVHESELIIEENPAISISCEESQTQEGIASVVLLQPKEEPGLILAYQ